MMKIRSKYLLLMLACIALSMAFIQPAWAEEEKTEHYCDSGKGWEEWEELARKYPKDLSTQALHAIRIGLCAKIKAGTISVEDAIWVFEKARGSMLQQGREWHRDDEQEM